jgi:type IV pilus assembly protein PilO
VDLQDPKIQRLLIAVLLGIGILYVFFGTSYLPITFPAQRVEIEKLAEESEKLNRELERANLIVGNMAKLEREFEYLHRQWAVAQDLLPEDNEISGLLRQITAAGTQSGLEFVRFAPQPAIGHGFFTENPVDVEVEGSYHQVGSFISQLSNLNRIINVRNLHLQGVKPTEQAKPENKHTVATTMEIVAYSMDSNAAAADMEAGATQTISANQTAAKPAAASVAKGGH